MDVDYRLKFPYGNVFQITPQCTEEMYIGCQYDTLFENEMTAYTDIIPTLGKADLYPKYEIKLAAGILANIGN